jgi:hypothetical protein
VGERVPAGIYDCHKITKFTPLPSSAGERGCCRVDPLQPDPSDPHRRVMTEESIEKSVLYSGDIRKLRKYCSFLDTYLNPFIC